MITTGILVGIEAKTSSSKGLEFILSPLDFQTFLRPWGEGGKGEERGRPLNDCYGISQDFSWGPPAIFVCACILHGAAQTPLAPL